MAETPKVAMNVQRSGMTSSYHRMFATSWGGVCCNKASIVESDLAQKGQVTFPSSHSGGRASVQKQRGLAPEHLAWKSIRWECQDGCIREQIRLERWTRSLALPVPEPRAMFVSQPLSLTPRATKQSPRPVPWVIH